MFSVVFNGRNCWLVGDACRAACRADNGLLDGHHQADDQLEQSRDLLENVLPILQHGERAVRATWGQRKGSNRLQCGVAGRFRHADAPLHVGTRPCAAAPLAPTPMCDVDCHPPPFLQTHTPACNHACTHATMQAKGLFEDLKVPALVLELDKISECCRLCSAWARSACPFMYTCMGGKEVVGAPHPTNRLHGSCYKNAFHPLAPWRRQRGGRAADAADHHGQQDGASDLHRWQVHRRM